MNQKPIVTNMPNEVYHHSMETRQYISSTQLKNYAVSPAYAKYMREHPEAQSETPSMQLGSQFHALMEKFVNGMSYEDVAKTYAIFSAPVNPKTLAPYGDSTAKYQEAYAAFVEANKDKEIISEKTLDKIMGMAFAIMSHGLNRSLIEFARPKADHLKGAEISFFTELEEGIGAKIRVDAITSNKVIDWKTTSGNLDPDSLAKTIINFDYDVSAAFYQYVLYRITGNLYSFYWVFVKNSEPFEATVPVSAENFAFATENDMLTFIGDEAGELIFNRGVMRMRAFLNEHIWCTKNDTWPGSEVFIEPNDKDERIIAPTCPAWALANVPKYYN